MEHTLLSQRNSIWELTWDHMASLNDLIESHGDTMMLTNLYEIAITDVFVTTEFSIFNSFLGHRRINGIDFHGPIYNFNTDTVYNGPRFCSCHVCEAGAQPIYKKN